MSVSELNCNDWKPVPFGAAKFEVDVHLGGGKGRVEAGFEPNVMRETSEKQNLENFRMDANFFVQE